MELNLSINKDTQGTNAVPIQTARQLQVATSIFPYKYEFPTAFLVKVSFEPEKEVTRNDVTEKVPALGFLFKDKEGRQLQHWEYPIDMTSDSAQDLQSALIGRIKHIWDETIGADKLPDGAMSGKSFSEFYDNVSKAFNSIVYTKDDKPRKTYASKELYLKVTFWNTRVQLPKYPNFIQQAKQGENYRPCELRINTTYDILEPKSKPKAGQAGSAHDAGYPSESSFSSNFADDLPDV
jgi:hypothetical protein